MIALQENGRAKASGVGMVPVLDMRARAEAMEEAPAEPHALSRIGNALGLEGMDSALGSILNRDTAWSAPHRAEGYDAITKATMEHAWDAVKAVRGLDPELPRNVRSERASKAVCGMWEAWTNALSEAVAKTGKAVEYAEKVYAAAWTPADDADPALVAAQDREIRDVLRATPESDRIQLIAQSARAGKLGIFRAIEEDPFGLLTPGGEVMARSKSQALEAAGLAWVETQVEDARDNAATVHAMARLLRDEVIRALGRQPVNVEITFPHNLKALAV